ncbi:hypothetical protein HDU83_005659 [Entophlyctis luteolus]|nr:hypothetical protein HDU83_005659 [Entophlyctis luteolus]
MGWRIKPQRLLVLIALVAILWLPHAVMGQNLTAPATASPTVWYFNITNTSATNVVKPATRIMGVGWGLFAALAVASALLVVSLALSAHDLAGLVYFACALAMALVVVVLVSLPRAAVGSTLQPAPAVSDTTFYPRAILMSLLACGFAAGLAGVFVCYVLKPVGSRTLNMAAEVLARRMQHMQALILNRPHALNALNLNMVYEESDITKTILLTAVEGSRAFCAGGDIKALLNVKSSKPEDIATAVKFMQQEYQLNHLIGTLSKPFISVLNGITMGGGAGLSVHAPFRIATEKTIFAMPETAIGLFPDVGGSFFLPRLDGELGTFLGLTGHRLFGQEVWMAGIATHFVPSERLPMLLDRLANLETSDLHVVDSAINEFVAESPTVDDWHSWSLGRVTESINRCFSHQTLEAIVSSLENEGTEWSANTLQTLQKMSPTSLKVTLEQLRRGRQEDFATCFRMEYRMVQESLQSKDFFEGVTAALVEKRTPVWNPDWAHMDSLKQSEIEKRFFTLREKFPESLSLITPRLEFGNDRSFFEYPHKTLSGLPTDRDVLGILTKFGGNSERVVEFFNRSWGTYAAGLLGKENRSARLPATSFLSEGSGRTRPGLTEKVLSILARNSGGKL